MSVFRMLLARVFIIAVYLVLLILMLSYVKVHADTEIWGLEDTPEGNIKIELNVDGCITSFTVPKKKLEHEDNLMDKMLDMAEKRQRLGCH